MTSELFQYDKPKVIQALRYHFISRREIKIIIILVNVFAIVSATLFFLQKISPTAFFTSTIVWLVIMIMVWFVMPSSTYKSARTFQDSFMASFTDEGFGIGNDITNRAWEWKEVSTYLETPHFFHIYFSPRSFFLVPKDAFASEDISQVRSILSRHVTKG